MKLFSREALTLSQLQWAGPALPLANLCTWISFLKYLFVVQFVANNDLLGQESRRMAELHAMLHLSELQIYFCLGKGTASQTTSSALFILIDS